MEERREQEEEKERRMKEQILLTRTSSSCTCRPGTEFACFRKTFRDCEVADASLWWGCEGGVRVGECECDGDDVRMS